MCAGIFVFGESKLQVRDSQRWPGGLQVRLPQCGLSWEKFVIEPDRDFKWSDGFLRLIETEQDRAIQKVQLSGVALLLQQFGQNGQCRAEVTRTKERPRQSSADGYIARRHCQRFTPLVRSFTRQALHIEHFRRV